MQLTDLRAMIRSTLGSPLPACRFSRRPAAENTNLNTYVNLAIDEMAGKVVFSTTRDGGTILTEAMRLNNAGHVIVGSGEGGRQCWSCRDIPFMVSSWRSLEIRHHRIRRKEHARPRETR